VIESRPLPETANLSLLLVRKTGPTPHRYPRRPGIPAKQPL
jgi:16S rRNA (guanine527-N7)-methyltransferase